MKVLFIYPNLNAQVGFNYGVAFLSAVLKRAGHETRLLNVNEQMGFPLDLERIKREVVEFQPDLIGFSVVTNQYQHTKRIAESIRTYWAGHIVAGGVHPTMVPEDVLASGLFDSVCIGEGEGAILELATALDEGREPTRIPNLWLRKSGELMRNPVRPFVDLVSLPEKDYEIFDFQRMIDAKNGWVGLMASRGCPFRCTYCFNHGIVRIYERDVGKKEATRGYVRQHRVDDVLDEIKGLVQRYANITTFIFDDDIFTLDKKYLAEFCEKYAQQVGIPFVCNAHVKVFDRDTAQMLKAAGCYVLKFGLESGSERVRYEILKRRMSNDEIVTAFAAAHEVGLHTSAFVMFGFPGENISEIQETIDLLAKIQPGRFRWALFFPFVGTEAYDMSVKGGFVDFEKMARMENFFEESCLNFNPAQNLLLRKLQKAVPWYVNAHSKLETASLYAEIVRQLEALDEKAYAQIEREIVSYDKELSSVLEQAGKAHYSIKYNDFMAVRNPEVH